MKSNKMYVIIYKIAHLIISAIFFYEFIDIFFIYYKFDILLYRWRSVHAQ